jgi:hypothetical protein
MYRGVCRYVFCVWQIYRKGQCYCLGTTDRQILSCLWQMEDILKIYYEFFHFIQRGNAASIRGTFPDSAILSEIFVL